MKPMKCCVALVFCLGLAACSGLDGAEEKIPAADQAQARALLEKYESARAGKNWLAAETIADRLREKYPGSEAAGRLEPGIEQVHREAELSRESSRLGKLWDYQSVAVGKGVQRSATLYSRTAQVEEGDPAPNADAQLVLRDHPTWGYSVYLLLAQSHFECGKPCAMQISFDGAQARRFAGKQADSGKGPALFIEDEKNFVDAMSHAKKVRIELPKGSGRIPALVFEVGGYDSSRFAKP